MIKNYFLTAWRNISRNKIYSGINILGLSLGLASAMLIILFTKDEISFDGFHSNGKNIYRIVSKKYNQEDLQTGAGGFTGYYHGPAFAEKIPEIKAVLRYQLGYSNVKLGTEIINQKIINVDSGFLKVFSFPVLYGDAATCLTKPDQVVVSEDMAFKYFGTRDAVGKTLMVKKEDDFVPFSVSAVTKNVPQNTSMRFDVLMPIQVPAEIMANKMNWFNFFLNTFVLLNDNTDVASVEKKMKQVYDQDAAESIKEMRKNFDDKSKTTYLLQSLSDLHLNSEYRSGNGLVQDSNPWYSYILSGIALFILGIACINFINLTIAKSVKRSKEIGIRKVVGGNRKQLMWQFIGESFLLSLFSFLLALLMVQLALPIFNDLSNKQLSLSYLMDYKLIVGYIALLCITAFLAGFYPALVLSAFDPVKTLYNRFQFAGKNYLQKGLVILQFTLATILIIGTITIYRQFNFLVQKPLGYNDKNLISVEKESFTVDEFSRFENALKQNASIKQVAPHNGGFWSTGIKVNGDQNIITGLENINEDYFELMGIPVILGRNFSREFVSDSAISVIVNETFVKVANWKDPLEKEVDFFWNNNKKYQVIGVVKDHHFSDLLQEIGPQVFTMNPENDMSVALIRIKEGEDQAALKHIQATFNQLFPLEPYSFKYRVEENNEAYQSENKWKQMFLFGAVLTIFISCIGLFGLSVLNAERRTKEIGIRKILGAPWGAIVLQLIKDFLMLVSLALVIGIPVSWYLGLQWLDNYPYRIQSGWMAFLIAAGLVLLVAFFTLSFQAVRAALSNPIKSLRSE